MTASVTKLGPGLVTIGAVGSEVDFSCQVIGTQVEWSEDKDDDVTVLCGDVVAGATTYTAVFSGTLFQDLELDDGIVEYTWAHKGEPVPLVFVPNTTAGKQVTGTVVPVPLTVGSDESGTNMQSDFEWAFVGEPELAPYVPVVLATAGAHSDSS